MDGPQRHILELLQRDQPRAQAVVDIVVVVGHLIGEVGKLCLERGLLPLEEPPPQIAERGRIVARAMLEDALARLERQVQAVKAAVALFQPVHHQQALQVVLETAVRLHAIVERILACVAERRVAQVVRERDGLHQVFVQPQAARDRPGDLRHLKAVRQARAKQVALVVDEDLCLVFEPPEGRAVDDAVAIALELGARGGRRFGVHAAARLRRMRGVGSEMAFQVERRGRHIEAIVHRAIACGIRRPAPRSAAAAPHAAAWRADRHRVPW
ncbi:Uncharacterised protein [Ralstonia mannitolilytica]|uniref:Uncharacterized protein n=1 Tax=Ralstonia mannitolilytica TaxID=105219 RepID=A0AAJ5D7C9_9RALS|nr:Uncharacterised protein [Ralstonia mannitolilytica]